MSDSSADFGTNLNPAGVASNAPNVVALPGSSGNQGSYYVWKGSSGGGLAITVDSSQTWIGTISASENAGTAGSMTVASGVLRYSTSAPTSYAQATASTAVSVADQTWEPNGPKHPPAPYVHYYSLRVDWTDDPGTFSTTVTYTVSTK